MDKELTDKQKLFCMEYVKDHNGTRAYLRAYPNTKKESTASTQASALLQKPEIKAYLTRHMEKIEEVFAITHN